MERFETTRSRIGRYDPAGKKLLLPLMAPSGSRLLAASFRAHGIDAEVMETYQGLALGKEFTSGKECYPCMVTIGDILTHLHKEKERLGGAFSADNYVYFMPEAGGPCRFGMYNTLQRMVLDQFPELRDVPIVAMTADDSYSSAGIIPESQAGNFRKLALNALIISDAMERTLWRVRPYESRPGAADAVMEESLKAMEKAVESGGTQPDYGPMEDLLSDMARTMKSLMDPRVPRRPRIGIIGEIYVRCHPDSNQHIIREIESSGGEVVNSSVAEWFNFVSYLEGKEKKRQAGKAWRRRKLKDSGRLASRWLALNIECRYMESRGRKVYGRVQDHLDIQSDHQMGTVERQLADDRYFSFDIGTETPLSIGGALEFVHEGFNGVVNVYPFTCMPGTMASAVLNPLLNDMKIPYLESPYDGTIQPNREIAIRTFVHQARQHKETR